MQTKFQVTLTSALQTLPAPVFLAGFEVAASRLILHVSAGCDIAKVRSQAKSVMEQAGEPVEVSVRAHRLRELAFPRSLEHWLKRLEVGDVMHDPTMIVSRARGLVQAAKSCRSDLGEAIRGSFFDPERRTLFVLTYSESDVATTSALRQRIATTIGAAWDRMAGQTEGGTADWPQISVQVVADLPRRKVIPVDARSASLACRIGRAIRRWLAPGAVALAVAGTALPAAASIDPVIDPIGPQAIRGKAVTASVKAGDEFGVLAGLAVFADGQRRYGADVFASAGLQLFFGDMRGDSQGLLLAARTCVDPANPKKRVACPPFSYRGS